jgi:glutaredoxin-like protein
MIPLKDQEIIRQKFANELVEQVKVDLFTQRDLGLYVPGKEPCPTCRPTQEMLQELAALTDKISLRIHVLEQAAEEAKRFGVERVPAIVLRGKDGPVLKFYGIPSGYEFPEFIETIVHLSRGEPPIPEDAKQQIRRLRGEVRVQVFVTPTCPYCPQMARSAFGLAMVNPKVKAEVVEVSEFPELARRYNVRAVPLTVINDRVAIPGAVPPRVLAEQVVKAATAPLAGLSGPQGEASQLGEDLGGRRPGGLILP